MPDATVDEKAEVMWRIGATTGHAAVDADQLAELINGEPTPETDVPTPQSTTQRTAEDVAAEPRPLGWLFDQNGSRWTSG